MLVAAVAIVSWFQSLDVGLTDFKRLTDRLELWLVPFVFGLLCLHVALAAVRWSKIEVALGGQSPDFRRAFGTGAIAVGLGAFLPAPVVNIVCRGLSNKFSGNRAWRGAVGGGIDQLTDFVLALVLTPAALIGIASNSITVFWFWAVSLIAVAWLVLFLLGRWRTQTTIALILRRLPMLERSLDLRLINTLFFLSTARFVVLTSIAVLIAAAVDMQALLGVLMAVPPVTVVTAITMLPGSIGATEWGYTANLAVQGVPYTEITVFVLANRVVLTCLSVVMGLVGQAVLTTSSRAPH